VLSAYGAEEFSTKQLEKDFGNAAYATIRNFVIKFEQMGLLSRTTFGSRVKYRLNL
jgi:transcriptional regulator of heat shock response